MVNFISVFNSMISTLLALIFIPLSGLTYGIDAISFFSRPDTARVNVAGIGAYFRSQGITYDGEYFYFSSRSTLIKTRDDGRTAVQSNLSAIPDELRKDFGIKHIGGISYYGGKIYAGLEDSKVFEHPIIGVFDAATLELEAYYPLDERDESGELLIKKGVPWVAVNPETGLLYCADHNKEPGSLFVYDTKDNMKIAGEIPLPETVYSIQGGEFYGGALYVATNDETQAVYRIDISTGEAVKVLDRNLTPGSEGEGMTIVVRDGKPVITAIDMGPLFVNAFVREYNMNND